jgi:uncharacterized protein (DUF1800 family)
MRHFITLLFTIPIAHAAVTVAVSPTAASIRAGATKQFYASVSGAASHTVTWTASVGQISATGLYTAPASLPTPNTVTITATSAADHTTKGSAIATLLNPLPVVSSASPNKVNIHLPFTLLLTGTGFLPGSKCKLGDAPLTTEFTSSTQLKCSGVTSAGEGSVLSLTVVNPDPGAAASSAKNITVMAPVKVTISPSTATVRAGDSKDFNAGTQNAVDHSVKWYVNGVEGGDAAHGTIDANGLYQAPPALPTPASVTITVASVTDPTSKAASTVSLLNPLPVITSVAPVSVAYGSVSLTINGTGFAAGAQVTLGSTPLSVVWGSTSTRLVVTGTASPVPGGLASITVSNPNPGASVSPAAILAVGPANPKVSYNAAYRFLEQATFGPDPASIAHVQQVGFDQWLNEQLNAPVSDYTDPPDTGAGFSPTQSEFFVHAFTGGDPLRQRAAFALSQIWVISGVKVSKDVALVPFLRILNKNAFGNYYDLMHDVTLNPAMGNYLDMVNNDKFNLTTGVAPNENYARELMQLFTIGTTMLNLDGSNTTNPATPTYDQNTVATMARVFTGWTYPPFPGTVTVRHNPAGYFSPMVAIESNHDTDPKMIFGHTLSAGQSAEQDLDATLQILFNHPNVGPFVALRMIQHMVKSNPSPAYVARVAGVFNQSPRGNMWNVVKAVLLDPEARAGDSAAPGVSDGHLREPVLLMTHLLKSLGANVLADNPLTSKGTDMGQKLFNSPSVFNYYSPFFRVAGGALLGPEFQLMTPSTSLLRPNFVWSAATNGLGSHVTVDISPFTALAQQPDRLLDALNTALLHGQMDTNMRSTILTALAAVKDPKQRAQYAIFLVGSSSQYQVEE